MSINYHTAMDPWANHDNGEKRTTILVGAETCRVGGIRKLIFRPGIIVSFNWKCLAASHLGDRSSLNLHKQQSGEYRSSEEQLL